MFELDPWLATILLYALGGLAALVGLLLLLRELVCWYLKINKRLSVMTEVRDLLMLNAPEADLFDKRYGEEGQANASEQPERAITEEDIELLHAGGEETPEKESETSWTCECGNVNVADESLGSRSCPACGRSREDAAHTSSSREPFPDV